MVKGRVMRTILRILVLCLGMGTLGVGQAHADLTYAPDTTPDGVSFILVKGSFSYNDELGEFSRLVRTHNASIVTFDSVGGNVAKAMELGRLIRSLGLATFQFRTQECASACSLAFMGGVFRYAEAGSIGVHKSSFRNSNLLSAEEAVSQVQELTAEVMIYMSEMGVDPSLLKLSLKYDSDDIRYLSRSEMEQYRVVTTDMTEVAHAPAEPAPAGTAPQAVPEPPSRLQAFPPAPPPPSSQIARGAREGQPTTPVARTGRVRHPKGRAPMKVAADGKAADVGILRNGTPLTILGDRDRWYRVRVGNITGYMHHTWVYVDQFESGPFDHRHVQIKSFDNLYDALTFAETSSLQVDVYLATNAWYAVTLRGTFEESRAKELLRILKGNKAIPSDSFVTYSNTYVGKVCCN